MHEDETSRSLKRRRRCYPVDPCLGYYNSLTRTSSPTVPGNYVTNPEVKAFAPAKSPPSSLLHILATPEKPVHLSGEAPGGIVFYELDFPSPTTSPVVTVEAFLQRSVTKRIKTYKKRKRALPLVDQSDQEDNNRTYSVEGQTVSPPRVRKKPCRRTKNLPQKFAKPLGKKTSLISRLAHVARFTNTVDHEDSFAADDRDDPLLVPLDFVHVHDLDIPFPKSKQKSPKANKWVVIDPRNAHTSGFPSRESKPRSPNSQTSASPGMSDLQLKPLTHWSKNFSIAKVTPPTGTCSSRGGRDDASVRASESLKLVSWKEHEVGLQRFKMQHSTPRVLQPHSVAPRAGIFSEILKPLEFLIVPSASVLTSSDRQGICSSMNKEHISRNRPFPQSPTEVISKKGDVFSPVEDISHQHPVSITSAGQVSIQADSLGPVSSSLPLQHPDLETSEKMAIPSIFPNDAELGFREVPPEDLDMLLDTKGLDLSHQASEKEAQSPIKHTDGPGSQPRFSSKPLDILMPKLFATARAIATKNDQRESPTVRSRPISRGCMTLQGRNSEENPAFDLVMPGVITRHPLIFLPHSIENPVGGTKHFSAKATPEIRMISAMSPPFPR